MSTNKKTKWKLIDEEITDMVFTLPAKFHFVITDKMFQRIAKFAKDYKGVAFYIGQILESSITILRKVTQRNSNWKIFQHLKPEIDDENEAEVVMTKHNSKTKLRKHTNHHLLVHIPHPVFRELKDSHARLNTFSMSLLARIIIELFLHFYEECNDYDKAINKLYEVVMALYDGEKFEKCEACFKLYKEVDQDDKKNPRIVVFFVVNLKSSKLGVDFHFRLRL